jgi:hypothetical protein
VKSGLAAVKVREKYMKIIAGIGLLCFVYGFIQVIVGWTHRNKTQNTLRLTAIAIGGGICIAALLR